MTRILSKSRYTSGLQCHKLLWLKAHEPDAPELRADGGLQARFDNGHRVGERAQAEFVGGTLINLDPRDRAPAIEATRAALNANAPVIYEASFEADGAFAAVDILERNGAGWTLIEVKATLSAKPQHLPDLAIQVHLARRNGLHVDRVQVMHLNRAHRHPDIEPLFVRSDVTDKVNALVPSVAAEIARQQAMLASDCPTVAIGDHCDAPYECPFKGRCWPERPKHDVGELYKLSHKAEAFRELGYESIGDIPDTERLGEVGSRQRRAVISGALVVDPGLDSALSDLTEPIAFLDFETIAPALPLWNGCAPYQAVPVQHSVHRIDASGAVTHLEFLATPGADPREELARHLLEATHGAATVLAWSASFERSRIEELAKHLPALRVKLRSLAKRMTDLLPIVRNHVYHPDFRGSFSLKSVGPALVPELGYEGLDVADGMTAATQLEKYQRCGEAMPEQERAQLEAALLAYCGRDTEMLVGVYSALWKAVAPQAGWRA
jgi:Domain of unknown function(DUF2779)